MFGEFDFVLASALDVAEPAEPTEPKIERREVKIELRDGTSFMCECVVEKEEIKSGQTIKKNRLIDVVLVNGSNRIDLRQRTGLPKEFPILEGEELKPALIIDDETEKGKIYVRPLLDIENLAVFLHEVGHYVQRTDKEFSQYLLDLKDKKFFEEIWEAVENKKWIYLARHWSKIKEIFLALSLKNVRSRFHRSFLDFQRDFSGLDILFQEYLDLDDAFWQLQEELQRDFDQNPDVDTSRFDELDARNKKRQEAIVAGLPIDKLCFFLYEPIRIKERDASRRAIIWLREIGETLRLPELANSEDHGSDHLLTSALPTYSTGCIRTKEK